MVETGCDRVLRQPEGLVGRRYGFLGHGASITADCRPAHLALAASNAGPATALFGPEHGYYGVEQYMVGSRDQRDPLTGIPIVSLYGEDAQSLRPDAAAFAGIDVLLVDLQDVGSRYYTYAATAVWAAEVALAAGVEVWVLDRPNPLGGEIIEGGRVQSGFHSFVGAFDLPVRHGLTLGELMLLEASRRDWNEGLSIWEMAGWERRMLWADTGLPWTAPSPNMPTPVTSSVYPGGCLFEATTISEGRGTTRPFQLVGAPGIDVRALIEILEQRDLPGVQFLPAFFRPQFEKHVGELCTGVQVQIMDPNSFPAYRCGIELLAAIHDHFPESFGWRREPYEFVSDRPAIDLLTGGAEFRAALTDGGELREWVAGWAAEENAFREERRGFLLYS